MTAIERILLPFRETLDSDALHLLKAHFDMDFQDHEDIIIVLAQLKRAEEHCRAALRLRLGVPKFSRPEEFGAYLRILRALLSRKRGS